MRFFNKARIVILGAGFGGLELSTLLSETLGNDVKVTVIDKSDAFVFGFSKLDVMFGRKTLDTVRMPYRRFSKKGVQLRRETVTAIDPGRRRVTTDRGTYDADFLIVALGAGYDIAATPGLAQVNEFYSVEGAARLRSVLPTFKKGRALIGVCGAPYKCPPGPSECALMLHDDLVKRGVREACEINFVLPLSSPVPPSPETSQALVAAFAERNIKFMPGRRVVAIENKVAILDDGAAMPFDLFLGVPKHRVPSVVADGGLAVDGWIPVNPRTLETEYPGVYAIGDGANTGTPKAGVFAEGAARAVASALIAKLRNTGKATQYDGFGTCYIEFGGDRIGKVEVDFFSGPKPIGVYHPPSVALRADKEQFGASRRARWFGM
jgi:sulfide:quinone oxidoreductase